MKKLLVVLVTIALCTVLSATSHGEEPYNKSKPCEYSEYRGTVVEKLGNPDRIELETPGGLKEFFFVHDKKDGCISWKDLKEKERVIVSCEEKKNRLEATCVRGQVQVPTLQGVTIQGGKVQ